MVENIITIPKGKLQKGLITESGVYEDNNMYIRTTSVSSYAVPNDTAFLRCELDCEALKAKDITGSFDGTTDLNYNIQSFYDIITIYTTNPNYKVEYYWVFGYDNENVLRYAGYFGIRRPILGGNKDTEAIYVGSSIRRQSDGTTKANKAYCTEVDVGGDTITYYNSGQSGETTTKTVIQFIAGSLTDTYRFVIQFQGERESEFVTPDVALLGYGRINTSAAPLFSKRWVGGADTVEFLPDVPIVSFAFVFRIDGVENPPADSITTCKYTLQAYSWRLDSNNKLTNFDIALSTGDDIYTPPYPATMWYLDENDKLKNALLPDILPMGAFALTTELQEIRLPESLEEIGPEAFYGSAIRRVTIPNNLCTYYATSFPPGCVVTGGHLIE